MTHHVRQVHDKNTMCTLAATWRTTLLPPSVRLLLRCCCGPPTVLLARTHVHRSCH